MEKNNLNEFGELLSAYIKRQGIGYRYIASRLNCDANSVKMWLTGEKIPSPNIAILIPEILSLSSAETERLFVSSGHLELWPDINNFLPSSVDTVKCILCHRQKKEVGALIQVGNGRILICAECANESLEAFSQQGVFVRIARSIEFTKEYHQAGISILSYFGTVLREKYADLDAKVRIEQQGLKVTLVVESPTGERETIERALNEYGMVIKGDMSPEEFYDGNAFKVLELKQQLGIARLQLEGQRDLMRITASQYDRRIQTLEEQIAWLRSHVGNLLEVNPHALTVRTEGGAYIHGNVATQGGDVVARDAKTKGVRKKQKPTSS